MGKRPPNPNIETMKHSTPWVSFPGSSANRQPTEGQNHRTVNIRCGRGSVSIRCASRKHADRLGLALMGLFRQAVTPENPQAPADET